MIWRDDKNNEALGGWAVPTLAVVMVVGFAATMLFWLPLFLYTWHWWLR